MKPTSHWPVTVLSGAASILNMGLPMAMARLMPADQIGIFRTFFLYQMAIPALSLCIGLYSGLYFWAGQGEKGARALREASAALFWIALAFSGLILTLGGLVLPSMGIEGTHVTLFAVAVLPTLLGSYYESVCIATGRVWTGAWINAGGELLRSAAILIAVLLTRDLTAVLLTHVATGLAKVAFGFVVGSKHGLISFRLSREGVRTLLQYAAPVSAAAVFDLMIGYSDRFILSRAIDPSSFAIYMMGCLAIPPLHVFEQSVNKVLIPKMSSALSTDEPRSAALLYRGAVNELLLILLPATAGLIVFSDPIVRLLFTERYIEASEYLRVFALSYLMFAIPYDAFFRAAGDGKWIFRASVAFGLGSLGLGIILTQKWGAMGALSALLLAQFSLRLVALINVRRRFALNWGHLLPIQDGLVHLLLCTVLSAGALAAKSLFPSEVRWLLLCGPAFTLLYFGVVFARTPALREKLVRNGVPGAAP